jgi:hypothetical protein
MNGTSFGRAVIKLSDKFIVSNLLSLVTTLGKMENLLLLRFNKVRLEQPESVSGNCDKLFDDRSNNSSALRFPISAGSMTSLLLEKCNCLSDENFPMNMGQSDILFCERSRVLIVSHT